MAVVGPPLAQLPPEPLRWPLVQSVSLAYEASDRAHEQGSPPGPAAARRHRRLRPVQRAHSATGQD